MFRKVDSTYIVEMYLNKNFLKLYQGIQNKSLLKYYIIYYNAQNTVLILELFTQNFIANMNFENYGRNKVK